MTRGQWPSPETMVVLRSIHGTWLKKGNISRRSKAKRTGPTRPLARRGRRYRRAVVGRRFAGKKNKAYDM